MTGAVGAVTSMRTLLNATEGADRYPKLLLSTPRPGAHCATEITGCPWLNEVASNVKPVTLSPTVKLTCPAAMSLEVKTFTATIWLSA